jgi:hypothetical protein
MATELKILRACIALGRVMEWAAFEIAPLSKFYVRLYLAGSS